MKWFTSDTHFGHQRIIELCNRPFASVEEMDEGLIERWNAVVKPNDIVYHLGDVALGKIADSLPLVGRLNGTKVLIPGNHDRIFSIPEMDKHRDRFMVEYQKVFQVIGPEFDITYLMGESFARWFGMSHLPYTGDSHHDDRYADKRPVDEGLALICGHVHEKWRFKDRMFNVGVDANNYTPVSEDEVIAWARTLD